jgi:hypothetical protein
MGALAGAVLAAALLHLAGDDWLAYAAAGLFGTLVGGTELAARYKDKPLAPLRTLPGWLYLSVNGVAAVAALALIRELRGVDFGSASGLPAPVAQVLLAGFGTMAFFRSAFFTLRVGDSDVAIGPAAVLQVILSAADRACDRDRANPRSKLVARVMRGVAFDKAKEALPIYCFQLMQNVALDEQVEIGQRIATLATSNMNDRVKSFSLGLILMNIVGEEVLERAASDLGATIRAAIDAAASLPKLALEIDFDKASKLLVDSCLLLDPAPDTAAVAALRSQIAQSTKTVTDNTEKVIILLRLLQDAFNSDTVQLAVGAIKDTIKRA